VLCVDDLPLCFPSDREKISMPLALRVMRARREKMGLISSVPFSIEDNGLVWLAVGVINRQVYFYDLHLHRKACVPGAR
jgi:hypothetical protein